MSCDNLCTAAKCAELEERISRLEQALDLLEASFEAHTNQDIPQAHNYEEPEVDVSLAVNSSDNSLKVFVKVGNKSDDQTVTLPKPEEPEVDVGLAVNSSDNSLKVFVKVGNKSDDQTVTLPIPEEPDVAVGVFELGQNQFGISVQVGSKQDQDDFTISLPEPIEPTEPEPFNLSGSASYYDDTLTISIAGGGSQTSFQVPIPRTNSNGSGSGSGYCDCPEPEPINLSGSASYYDDILTITIAGGGSYTSFQVEIPMCDLDNLERLVGEIHDYTVIDIAGETVQDFKCLDPDNPDIPESQTLAYEGKGINGLHQLVKTINPNLLPIFTNSCQKPVLANPDWWQVRLGANRPQIVCTFRRGATRTYHSLAIPHPANTGKPEGALIPEYQKGNWQGMIVLNDNSKFIVNCISANEAERICNIAGGLISPNYLANPFKVWITERKGEPVQADTMRPTTIMYYSTGQRSTNPDWYFAIPKEN